LPQALPYADDTSFCDLRRGGWTRKPSCLYYRGRHGDRTQLLFSSSKAFSTPNQRRESHQGWKTEAKDKEIFMKILMVLTSHDKLGDTGQKTGFWLEEFAAPYYAFKDNNAQITLASPAGGHPPIDPKSDASEAQTEATRRFGDDPEAQKQLAGTLRLDDIKADEYDAIFYPGGHGPLWDLAEDRQSIALIEEFYQKGKPIGSVCHAPAAFRHATDAEDIPLVQGKKVTAFSNSEEAAVQLTEVVPFSVEDMLKENGGKYSKGEDWTSHIEVDGILVTGQNPASSAEAAIALLNLIR